MRFAFALALLAGIGLFSASAADRPAKPNIVLLLADDLGWQDVGCYDIDEPCPYETPNIDRLASEGIQFWQGYSPAPTCAPSRAAILSGRHPVRAQKTHVVGGSPPLPHTKASPLISPWYSGRMELSEVTLAEALKAGGYTTGHVGKWHVAINHHAFPGPADQGFDFTRMDRGVTVPARPDRLHGFATVAEADPYRLDAQGFPRDQNTEDALEFLRENKADPFLLYYATWLVHTPIHTRSEELLRKYCKKMGVPFPTDPGGIELKGQRNPYYGAMVEMFDHYVGQVLAYLAETEDPRWPGHRLSENTYVILTSDNGGMEAHPGEIITDNYPLDKGKINAKEGGVRVPLIIRGPEIAAGTETDAMANGLDFYPTILGWTGVGKPATQELDGCDLSAFLRSDSRDPALIVGADGTPRDTMVWHFPHSSMQSTIRRGGHKLIRNWMGVLLGRGEPLELFQLYGDGGERGDIEEAKNLAKAKPELAKELDALLEAKLEEMGASYPYINTKAKNLPKLPAIPRAIEQGREGNKVWVRFAEKPGSKVVAVDLLYTDNGGHRYEEWYLRRARLEDGEARAKLPEGATHYLFNLIDEHQRLVSYPEVGTERGRTEPYSAAAIKVVR